jgi:hypothetical protein
MAKAPTTEQTADAILGLFKKAHKRVGESMSTDAITIINMQIMTGARLRGADVPAGLDYAIKQGWLVDTGSAMKLTEAGFKRDVGGKDQNSD